MVFTARRYADKEQYLQNQPPPVRGFRMEDYKGGTAQKLE